MALLRCLVSFSGIDGIQHAVAVHAESLYEAVAMAVAEFRAEGHSDSPAAGTEFSVAIQRPAVEHKIQLATVTKWAERTQDGPAGLLKRQRMRKLLGNPG